MQTNNEKPNNFDEEEKIFGRPQIFAIFDKAKRMFVGMYLSLDISSNKSGKDA